jgi:Tol biopolymer transport system component
MKPLDRSALLVILISLGTLAGLITSQSLVPVYVSCSNAANCESISLQGSVTFTFSRPVEPEKIERAFSTNPSTPGKWVWKDKRHAQWIALSPIQSKKQIIFHFEKSNVGENNEMLAQNYEWKAAVRPPQVLYLSNAPLKELFKVDPDDPSNPVQLTNTDNRIFDYQPSPDGEWIIFSMTNDQTGTDLWMMDRNGKNQQILIDCGGDRCTTPYWSQQTGEIAYTREQAPVNTTSPRGTPRPWIYNLITGDTYPFFSDSQKIGYGPVFSPDGEWISLWNGIDGGILIVNRTSGETFLLPTASGDTGSWTHDGKTLYYEGIVVGETNYHSTILRAEIESQKTTTILGNNLDLSGYNYRTPEWNPAGIGLAIAAQPNPKIPGMEVWLVSPDGEKMQTISSDLSSIASFFAWSQDGQKLIFKVDTLSSRTGQGKIVLWKLNQGQTLTTLADNANFPEWLP